ncbi:MAG TPA: tyrosine-type recombinase/integrase [Nitrospira sp.]|nr:tyrosine-type recombinase/integrase [Nitrospira sp.]
MNDLSRRRYQRGSLSKDGSRWRARWREDVIVPAGIPPLKGDKPLGNGTILRRVSRNREIGSLKEFPTKRLAERELERILQDINREDYKPVVSSTFESFAEKWQKNVMVHHKPSTQHGERSVIQNHLLPAFGRMSWREITAECLQAWVSRQTDAPNSVRNRITTLREMWVSAKAWGYTTLNPFEGLKQPSVVKGHSYFFSIEESLAILNELTGWQHTLVRILVETGMRPGEAAGLRTQDLVGRVLKVSQSVFNGKIQTPKTTNAVREFAISTELAEEIERLTPRNGLLFTTSTGRPICMKNFLKWTLDPVLDKLGIKAKAKAMGLKCGSYAFRHGNVTEMRRRGVPLKTIQKRVGHSAGSGITDEFYTHAVDADDMAAADMWGELLRPTAEGEPIQ